MKPFKKLPSKQLERFSTVFMQLGLVLVLFIVYVALEHKTEEKKIVIADYNTTERIYVPEQSLVIFKKEPKAIETKVDLPKPTTILDEIKKGNNEVKETPFNVPKDLAPKILNPGDIITAEEPKEEPIEDVPFLLIEDAPIFKGCEGLSKKENKICFEEQMRKFIQKNFDVELAQELGLNSGKKKIFTQFVIDENGNIINVLVKAPHPKLEKEAQRVIDKLPKFTPGKQRGNAVKVRYALPITFQVE